MQSSVRSDAIPDQVPPFLPPSVADAREFCDHLLSALQRIEIGKKLGGISEDTLGAYFFRVPEVHLYWMVIGLVAGVLGITVESRTVEVATHELAHAYSHLGRDIDRKKWETEAFARTDLNIVEGIAQFYTEVVAGKLETRNPPVLPAYQKLTEIQQGPTGFTRNGRRGNPRQRHSDAPSRRNRSRNNCPMSKPTRKRLRGDEANHREFRKPAGRIISSAATRCRVKRAF
jgi:hypothetical protein